MEKSLKNKFRISPYLLVILSFLAVLLVGAFLITCPFCRTDFTKEKYGEWGYFVDSLFMSTSATCVTGFDCYPDGLVNTLNFWGQFFLCVNMQVGGLGFMTIFFFIITVIKKKLSFKDRLFISQTCGSNDVAHVKYFLRKILFVTFIIEIIGTLLFLPVLFNLRAHGYDQNPVWGSIFLAVSCFNNAGLDLFGTTSFIREGNAFLSSMDNWAYVYMLVISMLLIIFGGISYLVIFEVFSFKKKPRQWSAFSKICICMMLILNIAGACLLLLIEHFNSQTDLNFFHALFLSVSSRTAGFASIDPYALSAPARIFDDLLMFIGGSPLGTASGIKTTTLFIIIITIYSYFRGRSVYGFKRKISQSLIAKTMAITITSFSIVLIGYLVMCSFECNNPNLPTGAYTSEHALYETMSAFSTTGFTTAMTPYLSDGGKITCVVLMFVGRLGPITFMSIFSKNMQIDDNAHVKYIEEDILLG